MLTPRDKEMFAECDRNNFSINHKKNIYKVPKGKSSLIFTSSSSRGALEHPTERTVPEAELEIFNQNRTNYTYTGHKRDQTVRKSGFNYENVNIDDLITFQEKYMKRLKTEGDNDNDGESIDHRLDFGDGQNVAFSRRVKFMKVLRNINKAVGIRDDDGSSTGQTSFVSKIERRISRLMNKIL